MKHQPPFAIFQQKEAENLNDKFRWKHKHSKYIQSRGAREVFSRQDIGVKLAESYRSGIYYERNRTMIDHSSELICYHDGGRGGTAQTVLYARSKDISVYNLFTGK